MHVAEGLDDRRSEGGLYSYTCEALATLAIFAGRLTKEKSKERSTI